MNYKVIYHIGPEFNTSMKISKGVLQVGDGVPELMSPSNDVVVCLDDIHSVILFRVNGLGRMLKLDNGSITIYLTVYRIVIGNLLAVVNFIKTGTLKGALEQYISR